MPTSAPLCSIVMLVATVVPCTIIVISEGFDARLLANLQHAAQHAHRLVMWRARNLVDENLCTIILVHLLEDQIGEGSADVDSYSCHGHFLFEP